MVDSGQSLSHYTIIRPLGKGGMGEVFLAEDTVLGRRVALKFLAKDAIKDPVARGRFLREAKSAAAIDDPFICKIYETGEVDGEPFIAMEYIEGESLGDRIDRAPMSTEEVVTTASEIAEALGAAHEHGIIHRDLKPSNIMLTTQGHAKVLDFGLAKQVFTADDMDTSAATATSDDLTGRGVTLGTLSYMSPEQLKAQPLTPRSDVFSFGIVLHEMLTGKHPFARPSTPETMSAIMGDPPPAIDAKEGRIPQKLLHILDRALAKEPEDRFQNAMEMVRDLEEVRQAIAPVKKATHTIGIAMAIVLAAIVVVAGLRLLPRGPERAEPEAHEPVSVLIADFDNQTGEEVFDGALEQAVAIGLESAPFVNSYKRGRAQQVASQIQEGAESLDPEMARLVAQREAINVLVLGTIAGTDGSYRIEVEAVDGISGESMARHETEVAQKEKVLEALGDLVVETRRTLGDTVPDSVQLIEHETFTASSLEAARAYAEAQDLMAVGRWQDAVAGYLRAIQIDPDLGRAYAGAAASSANMGQLDEAERYYREAMSRIDRMTDREKYRSRGGYYLMTRNYAKAADEFAALAEQFPYDPAGLTNLPLAYFYSRRMGLAVEQGRRAIEIQPENLMARANLALYSMYAGDFAASTQQAAVVLDSNPTYELMFIATALSELAQGNPATAAEQYEALQSISAWGASLAAAGLADIALYEGRLEEAVVLLEQGIRGERAAGNEGEAARKLSVLAQTLADLGRADEALAAADDAVASSRRENVLLPAALVYLDLGQVEKALELAEDLGSRIGPDPQVYSKLVASFAEVKNGKPQQAVALLVGAQEQLDTWLGRFFLGRAFLEAGAFTEAHSEFERCLERRGEAAALFLDDVPTYRYLPPVHYWLGRALEGLGSDASAESYRTYLEIRRAADSDPLSADATIRLGSG
jgi:tetratricopeptide (TPR) repeat protein/tRNA A-37 threonylcarbamoyl transferase component Bud32